MKYLQSCAWRELYVYVYVRNPPLKEDFEIPAPQTCIPQASNPVSVSQVLSKRPGSLGLVAPVLDGLELEERAGDWTLQPFQVRVALVLEEAGADLPRLGVAHVGDRVGRLGPQEAAAQEAEDVVQRDRLRLAVDLE